LELGSYRDVVYPINMVTVNIAPSQVIDSTRPYSLASILLAAMLRFVHVVLAVCLLVPSVTSCTQESSEVAQTEHLPSSPEVDRMVEEARTKHNMPALAAVVVRSDSVVAVSATGIRRNGTDAPVTPHDRFHLGSNTKAMTATLLAMLVEDGALTWDTTPLDVFPALTDSIHAGYQDVTLDQLLAHRAGVPSYTSSEEFESLQRFSGPPTDKRLAFTSSVLQDEPDLEPGSAFHYSNAGYTIAAAMAEQVGSAPWEALMRDRLFGGLDIDGEFGFPIAIDSAQPSGHLARGDTLLPSRLRESYDPAPIIGPAGDANMNLADYGRFLQLHLRGLRGSETALLPASAIQFMHESMGGMNTDSDTPGYGLGWVVGEYQGERVSGHAGSIGRFKARAILHATGDVAVAVVANAGGDAADSATQELRQALLERYSVVE
jgi:CubicO group peptidase (beta-lactamase class C family)